jgi:hypothetical protein
MIESVSQVLQEVRDGQGVGLAGVARKFPNDRTNGQGHINASTVFRWCLVGCKGATGQRIRLQHVRIGSRILTSWPAVERFISSLTAPVEPSPIPRSPTQRQRASASAARALEVAGC